MLLSEPRRTLLLKHNIWLTKDQRYIPLPEMSQDHFKNTYAMMERMGKDYASNEAWLMICGPRPNGEHALDSFEEEITRLAEQEWKDIDPEVFAAFEAERIRRLDYEARVYMIMLWLRRIV